MRLDQSTQAAPWIGASAAIFAMLADLVACVERLELRQAVREREALPPAALH